jgi:deoxyribonuclease-4
MLRVGPAGYPEGSKNPLMALQTVHDNGLTALEMQFVRQAIMGSDKARSIRAKAEELGLLLSAHAPYYINFNSETAETVRKSAEWVLKTARIAHELGAWIIVVHAAAYGDHAERCTGAVTEGLGKCRDTLHGEGIEDVVLGVETMGRTAQWGTFEEIGEVVRQVKGVQPVIDWAHLHARGGGGLRGKSDFEATLKAHDQVHKGRMHCHFSCIEYTAAGEKRHLPLKMKEPDYAPLVELLNRRKGDVTMISETPVPIEGAVALSKMLAMHGKRKARSQ